MFFQEAAEKRKFVLYVIPMEKLSETYSFPQVITGESFLWPTCIDRFAAGHPSQRRPVAVDELRPCPNTEGSASMIAYLSRDDICQRLPHLEMFESL